MFRADTAETGSAEEYDELALFHVKRCRGDIVYFAADGTQLTYCGVSVWQSTLRDHTFRGNLVY